MAGSTQGRAANGSRGRSGVGNPYPSGATPDTRQATSGQTGAPPDRLRLVGSLRVSTVEQAAHGYGLDVQRSAIKAAAAPMGARIVKWCSDEGLSGALPAEDRPGLAEALGWLHDGRADGIIVRDLDRLAREVTVQEAILAEVWNRCGARAFTATGEVERDDPDDPMRTAMRQMAGVFAGLERRMIVKRLRDGRKAKAADGGHAVGALPYGYTVSGGRMVPDPAEHPALLRMLALHEAGQSTRAIAATLADEGHPTKRGGRWTSPVVARILARHTRAAAV